MTTFKLTGLGHSQVTFGSLPIYSVLRIDSAGVDLCALLCFPWASAVCSCAEQDNSDYHCNNFTDFILQNCKKAVPRPRYRNLDTAAELSGLPSLIWLFCTVVVMQS